MSRRSSTTPKTNKGALTRSAIQRIVSLRKQFRPSSEADVVRRALTLYEAQVEHSIPSRKIAQPSS